MNERDFRKTRIVKGKALYIKLSGAERLRVAQGSPQAVVKVISYAHGARDVRQCIDYISRKGTIALETECGGLIQGREDQKELVRFWSRDFGTRNRKRD